MYFKMNGACLQGIDGTIVDVEIDISSGLPYFQIVGLPDSSVKESTERVRSALKNSGAVFPLERITINLAPADVRKEGSSFDLAIATGVLSASGQLNVPGLERCLTIGELSLDGRLRPVRGVLSMVDAAKRRGLSNVLLPAENVREAMLIEGMRIVGIGAVKELMELSGTDPFQEIAPSQGVGRTPLLSDNDEIFMEDFVDVFGQYQAKRALTIAAAGFHNLIFIGPPGSGKTMLIRRLPSILPALTDEESLEVTKVYSAAGLITDRTKLIRHRPFRNPHHTVSMGGLVGAGSYPKPGEVSLAHRGVLFLDELPEFPRSVLEVLRQPIEDRRVTIGRARAVFTFPTHFMLAASMNPCPCGFYGFPTAATACSCSPLKVQQYRSRISGPLLERIDLHVEVPRIEYDAIKHAAGGGDSSFDLRARVGKALERQALRYAGTPVRFNGELTGRKLREHCQLPPEGDKLLASSFEAMGLSVRSHDRILKIARTIADLAGSEAIQTEHLAEALQYRTLDRNR
ncbi:YifB family Mg chelatase-like AAA ATPase [Paenibacillus ginsengarvi]|uniref:ATP-binding protein n=1 Tax=Paenibacillus ginsengarvi TaxID=400777 RepID=A0A3B0CXJ0_9BACL|nr:YifB family Mg chelatase-like AAA ATPase [Paenibacillus ginsengarvi]RKN86536.1 ATP-binding protein [Paenibacillus ginsengarvi]